MKKYQIIYADPPWNYNCRICRNTNYDHVSKHYPVMKTSDIKKINLNNILDNNCLLFIWITSPLLPDGLEVVKAWGFKYATLAFCWNKINPMPGSYTISNIELCFVAKKGNIPKPRGLRNISQYYEQAKNKHSRKPPEIRYRINQMFPIQNKIELFARKDDLLFDADSFEGWDVWGNEVESDINLEKI